MTENNKSLRIDWFDGTVVEESRPNTSNFNDDEATDPPSVKLQEIEKKHIGFKRLLDISYLKPPILNLELSNRPGFWILFTADLKDDFIVLIVKILASVYKSLELNEKTKIVTLLRNKLEKSDFFIKLKSYLNSLPNVKLADKRMNLQLWEDVEAFYMEVFKLSEAMFKFGVYGKTLQELYDLLEVAELSALGVQEEHMEPISERFYEQVHELMMEMSKSITKVDEKTSKPKIHDPDNFRNLNIFPSKEDLLGSNNVKIIPHIVNGAYPSVEHYLDLQFKLLREDYFGPLREGISKYLASPSKRKYENIRVYPKVRVIRTYVSNNKVGHLVDIAWFERISNTSVDCRKYMYNKRLMFGSLLLFTCDNFLNIICASVLDSSSDLLRQGYVIFKVIYPNLIVPLPILRNNVHGVTTSILILYEIAVSFQNLVSSNVFGEQYLMLESEVFFEPYHRVLKVLQDFTDDIPMRKYIVDVQAETKPPSYLTQKTIYSTKNDEREEISFPVLNINQWPSPETFGLDQSQFNAFNLALTREFAVIQGPPGTGKTFLGIKIASTLLNNLSLEGTPMLIICYTNHALDQFLEGILKVTQSVVRLGSQSKSKVLEPYNLNNLRRQIKSKYSNLYSKKRYEMEKIFGQMTELQKEIEKCEKEIVSYKTLKKHLKIQDKVLELNTCVEDAILDWLFEDKDSEAEDVLEEWEKQFEDTSDKVETCFSEEYAFKEIDSMCNSIKYLNDITDDNEERERITVRFQDKIDKIKERLDCFKKYKMLSYVDRNHNVESVSDLYKLNKDDRWKIYFKAVEGVKSELTDKMNILLKEHNICNEELLEVSTLIDEEVMKQVRVVGVTTSGAARRHRLINKLASSIVIVEEAAEVLEAHIIASFTHKCEHLILIGDHKQLRPTTAHYILAKHYNLDISLFERMIRNKIHSFTLTTQRRMRRNFVELLVPTIYDHLESYNVDYPRVRGMKDTLFFYSHSMWENTEGLEDSWSHKNRFEARWCVSLANYLRRLKYSSQDITILATYTGQVTLIKEMTAKHNLLNNVKVTGVDQYQGEENRIVILSLVRSNRDGDIGFLQAKNRICVALSRAKEGFYIFGNMKVLESASTIWRHIRDKLILQNSIGNRITVLCDDHNNTLDINTMEDLDNCLVGTCLRNCKK